jgi:small subunit ribosomal protein S17
MSAINSIGIPGIEDPQNKCDDKDCPFHGKLPVRGRVFMGTVVNTKMTKAITVRIDFNLYDHKYQRYSRKHSKVSVHCPPCIEVKQGDQVKFITCRKLTKTISSVVIQVMKKNIE